MQKRRAHGKRSSPRGEPHRELDRRCTEFGDIDPALFECAMRRGTAFLAQCEEEVNRRRLTIGRPGGKLAGSLYGARHAVGGVVRRHASGLEEHFSVEPSLTKKFGRPPGLRGYCGQ